MYDVGSVLHADSAEVSSTDILLRGFGFTCGTTGSGDSVLRQRGASYLSMMRKRLALLVLAALPLHPLMAALPPVSFEVAKALKVTRGKSIRSGLVFVDGKYLPPPYVVERYGNALRINGVQVTTPLIPWSDFLRTQDGAVVTTETVQPATNEAPAAVAAPEPTPAPAATSQAVADITDWDDPLADLFADEKPAKKKTPTRTSRPKPAKPVVRPPMTVTKVEFNGDFAMNDKAKALVERLNRSRTRVDAYLREDGFICFGSTYAQVSGGAGAAKLLLARLPELQRDQTEHDDFITAARASGLGFLSEPILSDLFRNRLDYVKLVKLRNRRLEYERVESLLK